MKNFPKSFDILADNYDIDSLAGYSSVKEALKHSDYKFAKSAANTLKSGEGFSLITIIMRYAENIFHKNIKYDLKLSEDRENIIISYKDNYNILMPVDIKIMNKTILGTPYHKLCDMGLSLFVKDKISRISIATSLCLHYVEYMLADYYGESYNDHNINKDPEVDKCIVNALMAIEHLSTKEMLYLIAYTDFMYYSTQNYMVNFESKLQEDIYNDLNLLLVQSAYLDLFADFPLNIIEVVGDDLDFTGTEVIKTWTTSEDVAKKTKAEDVYGYSPYYITYATSNYDFAHGDKFKTNGKIKMYIYDDSKTDFTKVRRLFKYIAPSNKTVVDIYVKDVIELKDYESQDAILSLYDKVDAGPYVVSVPADIIISNTIPLKESKLTIKIPNSADCTDAVTKLLQKQNNGLADFAKQHPQINEESYTIHSYIKIFDASDRIKHNSVIKECVDNPEFEMIGMMTIASDNVSLEADAASLKVDLPRFATYLPIWLDKPNNRIFVTTVAATSLGHITSGSVFIDKDGEEHVTKEDGYIDESDAMNRYNYLSDIEASRSLELWYGCQIALLNPIITNVVSESTTSRPFSESSKRFNKPSKKKTKIRYERVHYINAGAINGAIQADNSKRGFNRKCHCWYVIGHWRHYSNKTIWIDGYWKGDMRFLKKADEERTREVVPD